MRISIDLLGHGMLPVGLPISHAADRVMQVAAIPHLAACAELISPSHC